MYLFFDLLLTNNVNARDIEVEGVVGRESPE